MTPAEAVKLLDEAVSQLAVNRNTHVQLQTAISEITTLVEDAERRETTPKPTKG